MPRESRFVLRLAHINDLHSHFEPSAVKLSFNFQEYTLLCGGIGLVTSRINGVREQAAQSRTPFLFLDAGDSFQGSLYFSLYKGEVNATLQNILKPDATVLGNHEFDLGNQYALSYIKALDYPVITSNWDVSAISPAGLDQLYRYDKAREIGQYLVKEYDEHQVAVMGVTLDNMADVAHPDENTPFVSVESTLKAMIADAHSKGIFNIIVLSHLGYQRDLLLAECVEGISVIVGGHSHTWQGDFSSIGLVNKEPYGRRAANTLVFQASCNGLTLGLVDLEFDSVGVAQIQKGQNQLLIDEDQVMSKEAHDYLLNNSCVWLGQNNKEICHALAPYQGSVHALMNENVAQAQQLLRHVRIPNEALSSEVAPLVCDAFVWQANAAGFPVDCAIHNAGGVRVDVAEGDLTAGEVAGRLLPFAIDVVRYQVTGRVLKAALEGAINNAINRDEMGSGDGSFPYTSQLRYQYQYSKPKGERIISLEICRCSEWQTVREDEAYWVASSSYTALGKEGYEALEETRQGPESIGVTMADAFISYARECTVLKVPNTRLSQLID